MMSTLPLGGWRTGGSSWLLLLGIVSSVLVNVTEIKGDATTLSIFLRYRVAVTIKRYLRVD